MAINIPIISEFSDAGVKAAKAAFHRRQSLKGCAQSHIWQRLLQEPSQMSLEVGDFHFSQAISKLG